MLLIFFLVWISFFFFFFFSSRRRHTRSYGDWSSDVCSSDLSAPGFAREPWCRIRALQWPVSLHFPAPDRRNWTDQQRADELARWTQIIARPDGREHVYRAMLPRFGDILLKHGLAVTQQHTALAAALEREETLRARAQIERDAAQMMHANAKAERDAEQRLRAKAEAERDAERTLR